MADGSRVRIWVETIVGAASGMLAVVTVFWKDWLEAVFGWDPDHRDGTAEWLIVLAFAVVAAVLLPLARWEWRRQVRLGRPPSPTAS